MKEKRFKQGILFLALAMLLLIPASFSLAKYTETADVGTVTLNITVDPPVLDLDWKKVLGEERPTALVVGSFDEENEKLNQLFKWEDGTYIGQKSGSSYTKGVRLFRDGSTAYLLARGNDAVIFPGNSNGLFAGQITADPTVLVDVQTIDFNKIDTSSVSGMKYMFSGCKALTGLDLKDFNTAIVTNMEAMFGGCSLLQEVIFSNNFDVSSCQVMKNMFKGCKKLVALDVSSFKPSACTDMQYMFHECGSLKNLDLSNFDVSACNNMQYMFASCSALTELDVSSFKPSVCTNMQFMFTSCGKLTKLTFGDNFDTSACKNMKGMFVNCISLPTLDLSSFDTSGVTEMSAMFNSCRKLEEVKLGTKFQFKGTNGYLPAQTDSNIPGADGNWYIDGGIVFTPEGVATHQAENLANDVTEPTTYYAVGPVLHQNWRSRLAVNPTKLVLDGFENQKATILAAGMTWENGTDIGAKSSGFSDTVRLFVIDETAYILARRNDAVIFPKDSSNIFCGLYNNSWTKLADIQTIDFNKINTSVCTNMGSMFYRCIALTSLNLSSFDTSSVTKMNDMIGQCFVLKTVNFGSNFNTSKVTNMAGMFSNCRKLSTLNVSGFDTSNVTNMSYMFNWCGLKTLNLSSFNTSKVTNMNQMFARSASLKTLDFGSNFDTSQVTNMYEMFLQDRALTKLDLSGFNTSKVTNMREMFYNCLSLTTLDVSKFDTSNVTNMYSMFGSCSGLTKLTFGDNFDTSNVTNMYEMFRGCSKLEKLDLSSFNTKNVTDMSNMFGSCSKLREIKLGKDFAFKNGVTLPTPSSSDIPGADGLWYIDKENGYAPADVAGLARTEATTYYAVKTEAPEAPSQDTGEGETSILAGSAGAESDPVTPVEETGSNATGEQTGQGVPGEAIDPANVAAA